MHEYFVKGYSDIAKQKLGTDTLDQQMAYSIRMYCYGAVLMSREWLLKEQYDISAERVVQMMFNTMPAFLREVYFGNPVPGSGK